MEINVISRGQSFKLYLLLGWTLQIQANFATCKERFFVWIP